jgi:hypothetical protein
LHFLRASKCKKIVSKFPSLLCLIKLGGGFWIHNMDS